MTTTPPTTPTSPALLPCPLCDGPVELSAAADSTTGYVYTLTIRCTKCRQRAGRTLPLDLTPIIRDEVAMEQKIAAAKAELIAEWNQRAAPPALPSIQVESLHMIGAILDALIRYGHPSSPSLTVALAICARGLEGDTMPAPAYAAILAAVEDQRDRYRLLLADALPFLTAIEATALRRRIDAALKPLDARPIGAALTVDEGK